MEQIAASNSSAAESAKGILTLVKGNYYDVYIERATSAGGLGKAGKITATAPENVKQNSNVALTVYPNPANNTIFVQYNLDIMNMEASIEITDVTGKTVLTKIVKNTNGILEVNSAQLNSGFYFVRLSNGSTLNITSKIIITH